jgi:nucleotide-binding universal stress UspA family protein
MAIESMRRVLLHGGSDEGFDNSVRFAGRLAQTFGAELHVVYTVEGSLSAGWTAEMAAENLPELHQAIEAEARERLERLIAERQDAVTIAIRAGDASAELVRYTAENAIDLAIVHGHDDHARALFEQGHCSVLVLRK